jgi:hypothetical protein
MDALLEELPVGVALLRGPELRVAEANAACRALVDGRALVGLQLVEVWPELAGWLGAEGGAPIGLSLMTSTGRADFVVSAQAVGDGLLVTLARAAPALARSEARFQAVLDAMSEGVVVRSTEGECSQPTPTPGAFSA